MFDYAKGAFSLRQKNVQFKSVFNWFEAASGCINYEKA